MKYTLYTFVFLLLVVCPFKYGNSQIFDVDSNQYDTLIIGQQVWFKENLKTTRFSNGENIPNDTNNFLWSILSTPSYCNFNNDTTYVHDYGSLYNWFVVADSRNVCPIDWHVPTKNDWDVLIDELGGPDSVKGKLNEAGNSHWIWSFGMATNSSGFTALPGGLRYGGTSSSNPGTFNGIKMLCEFWTSTVDPEYLDTRAFSHYFYPDDGGTIYFSTPKQYGLSVRCIRNLATSVKEIQNEVDIKLFPNPTKGIFKIQIPESIKEEYEIRIYNLQGLLVYRQENRAIVNMTNFPKQMYIVRISTDNYQMDYYGKLIIE